MIDSVPLPESPNKEAPILPVADKEPKGKSSETELTIDDVLGQLHGNHPSADIELVRRAYEYAEKAHRGDKRKSGIPYIQHPLLVAHLLASLGMDIKSCAAGLLHDVVEDTIDKEEPVTLNDLRKEFGKTIANLVDGVTKIGNIYAVTLQEKQVENLRRMLVATARDVRVIIIKLCDRLHNMRTLNYMPHHKRITIARNTLDVYAPLAHRMGMGRIKTELEDLCLNYLEPGVYQEIKGKLNQKRKQREEYLDEVKEIISNRLTEMRITADIGGRAKHFYSIYKKMKRTGKDVRGLHDLVAVRLITDSIENCYAALGAVHSIWRPREGYFKDYISSPKPNDYRSLHTTVMGPKGWMVEIQIRTLEMHRIAEEGIAAHWRYKESGSTRKLGSHADWLGKLSTLLSDSEDPEEFMDSLKADIFGDEIYIYTPKGELIRLPKGSTPIDFAYRIHTDLGDTFAGAKVGGRFVAQRYELKTGDTVEVLTSSRTHPTAGWLSIVKTAYARTRIRRYLLQANRQSLMDSGRQLLTREVARSGTNPTSFFNSEKFEKIYISLNCKTANELFVKVGFGQVASKQVLARIIPPKVKSERRPKPASAPSMKVTQLKNLMYRRAQCCNPLPGEAIIGITTKSRGISIHRDDCPNITKFRGDPAQLIPLQWDEESRERTKVDIEVFSQDRPGLLADLSNAAYHCDANITFCNTVAGPHHAKVSFTIEIRDTAHLNTVFQRLLGVQGVTNVVRRKRREVASMRQKSASVRTGTKTPANSG
jgi:GTP diphosphokinase / guanosine-3',5'-bis(diphosphate) 3'-diphosphatase